MNIIITVSTFYPRKDGVQAVTEYLALGLKENGHNVTVVTSAVPGEKNQDDYKGIEILRVDISTKYALYFGDKKQYQQMILDLSKESDVIINVCTQNALTDYLYPILDKIECKKVLHMHGMYDFKWSKSDLSSPKAFLYKIWRSLRWGLYYKKRNFKKYDRIIQLHEFDDGYKYFYNHYGITCDVLENAAEDAFFSETLKTNSSPYAICVANYTERKNQQFVLEAFYKSNASNLGLVFIGSRENNYLNSLKELDEKLGKAYGIKNVTFLTDLDRETTIKYVKDSFLYLLGSTWEAFPISLIESMAAGVPFISTDVGISRFLPGGVIVNSSDEMSYWINIFNDNPNLALSYGIAGCDYYKSKLTIEDKVQTLEDIING